jgi:hypothetical protein
MKLELTTKEAFAISKSLTKRGRRHAFCGKGLQEKIIHQIYEEIGIDEINKLKEEWKGLDIKFGKNSKTKTFVCRKCKQLFKVENYDKKKSNDEQIFEPITEEDLENIE